MAKVDKGKKKGCGCQSFAVVWAAQTVQTGVHSELKSVE